MRAAVVAPGIHDRWNEAQLVGRRIAGALAHLGRVTVLVPGTRRSSWSEGLLDIHQHVSVPRNDHRAYMLEQALHGPTQARSTAIVPPALRRLEEELFLARGEYCPGMIEELAEEGYDVVVLAGVTHGHAVFAARGVPRSTPLFVAPAPSDRRSLRLGLVVDACRRAEGFLITTDVELDSLLAAFAGELPAPVRRVGFVVRTNELASLSLPNAFPDEATVVVAADWTTIVDRATWTRWASLIREDLGGQVQLRAVGPAANRLPAPFAGDIGQSRIDLWRWTSHALAVVDPMRFSSISVPSLEAMSYGVPTIVPADGGAARHHAEAGDGGLWYRTYEEFRGCVELLLCDQETRAALGRNGRRYADGNFGDTEVFVKDVLEAVQIA